MSTENNADISKAIKDALWEQLKHIRAASEYVSSEELPQLTMALCAVVDRLKDF